MLIAPSDQIIAIAKTHGAQAIIPGYGFLSENTDFARSASTAGISFVGPSPEAIESFGLKHTARKLAVAAGVPVVPGTDGLVATEEEAIAAGNSLGYPVMLKATAGGGGMGLLACANEEEVRANFQLVQSRATSLFKNAGVFLERYYPDSHHIEVQIFGNGQGKAISIGERECSIQRRHQKVIEESPSPFISQKHPELRDKLTLCAVRLAESIQYGSAGTVEYLVDDHTGDFFFLEMNTRLQVEHGITELCYGVDLVELMLRQTDCELGGKHGISTEHLEALQLRCKVPTGHAIEARVYAENPAKGYAPSPGLLQEVSWYEPEGARIDTWVQSGMTISSDYDPLIAKVMYHDSTREAAIAGIEEILRKSTICGPPVNLGLLLAIIQNETFRAGNTITKFLDEFEFLPAAIDVVSGGSYTLIQDFPGRPSVGHGFGHAGPMDSIAFQAANLLVGNPVGTEGLEITLTGPDLRFLGEAIISVCGPPVPVHLDDAEMPQWSRIHVRSGQRLKIGKMDSHCRVYLAIYGGLTNVAKWFGSKSTNPMVNIGGYQGRPLRAGDFLSIVESSALKNVTPISIPAQLLPRYTSDWTIRVMPGPYSTGYLSDKDIEMFFSEKWTVNHNAARGGIRLNGPRPEFARPDGGAGGAHPSNVIEYGYPLGGLDWTGDEPVIFPVDCPDFGGFICSVTIIKADMWKVGQLRAGDTVKFHRVSLESALECRRKNDHFLEDLRMALEKASWDKVVPFDSDDIGAEFTAPGEDVIKFVEADDSRPMTTYRNGADGYILIDYGDGRPNVNYKCRATQVKKALQARSGPASANTDTGGAIYNMVGCGNSLALFYDSERISREELLDALLLIEYNLGDIKSMKFPNRHFKLPLTFKHKKLDSAVERYMTNQRSIACYLPDPLQYVADNNGMTVEELKQMFLTLESVIIGVGFFMALPECLPTDPRYRINAQKMNPSRTYTPEGTVSWGGTAIAIYPVDSPGGYMPLGMTIPGVDIFGSKPGFTSERPWLFEDMDIISFYEVTEEEYDRKMTDFKTGNYHFEAETGVFDMAEHNALLERTAVESEEIKQKRDASQSLMMAKEKELMEQWVAEKKSSETSPDEVQSMLEGEYSL